MADDKPKKLFEIKTTIWDDGEVEQDIIEIVQQDRGAPKKWMRTSSDFAIALKRNTSLNVKSFLRIVEGLLGTREMTYSVDKEDDTDFDEE